MNINDEEGLGFINRLLEQLHQADYKLLGSIVLNIYKPGSWHVDRVENQHFYGDKWIKTLQGKNPRESLPSMEPPFDDSTPLSALFRENHHEELREVIESWRPCLIGDDSCIDVLDITRFEFDKDRIYSNRVYYDLLDLENIGAMQVSMSNLARYLASHTNLSSSYDTLYRQLKKCRQERS